MDNEILKVKIMKMEKEHLDSVVEIEELVNPNHHWSKDSFLNEIQNKLANYVCIIDTKNDMVLGFAGFWEILEEAHITSISVHPDFRRRGLATELMKYIVNSCYKKMIKYITLEVRASNFSAISLYEKFGFKSVGRRKKYYQDNNEDALIMFTENIWFDKFKNNFAQINNETLKVYNEQTV